MKTLQKILLVLIMTLSISLVLPQSIVRAADEKNNNTTTATSIIESIESANASIDQKANTKLAQVARSILSFLQVASGIASVIMIAITGFRYIIETPEVKGELKKNMFPIIIGILLVFFATSIARFFIGIFSQNSI